MTAVVVPHDPAWAGAFAQEAEALQDAFGATAVRVEHVGSTSIPGILAKPVIDILVAASDLGAVDRLTGALRALGYEAKGEYGIAGRRYFRKSNAAGVRTHHVHVFRDGVPEIARHLAFRDYLRAHPGIARVYSDLKADLTAGQGRNGRDYQDAKSDWIARTEADALAWIAGRRA
jgi:GrpB-like predicted nucleotidyltransferase (UPF0157 family)